MIAAVVYGGGDGEEDGDADCSGGRRPSAVTMVHDDWSRYTY